MILALSTSPRGGGLDGDGPSPQLPRSVRPPPSCILKLVEFSVKFQALLEEVDKILRKGVLELVGHPGQGYYSHIFGPGRWKLVAFRLAVFMVP